MLVGTGSNEHSHHLSNDAQYENHPCYIQVSLILCAVALGWQVDTTNDLQPMQDLEVALNPCIYVITSGTLNFGITDSFRLTVFDQAFSYLRPASHDLLSLGYRRADTHSLVSLQELIASQVRQHRA